ncbi:MAG: IS21-like element ISBf2 family transposase [Flavisolibacter sp.]
MNVHLAKFIMYFKIHEMQRDGFSTSQISLYLGINRRTVAKYLSLNEKEYEDFLIQQSERKKDLVLYAPFIKEKLELYPDTSSAQMHDWLKECHPDFPKTSTKTVFNFVNWVRGKYNIPKVAVHRQHHPVEELPYGKQAQVDFGEYNLRTSVGKRVKVFFFTLVLSRSRFKFIWFTDCYFTSELAIEAHEKAFEYVKGIPDEIVYDQDKVFIVNENRGDIILTDKFRAYTREKSFALHFCRKADPQSKGKVENVVKYVKQNFLYNRTYFNIETLNDDALGWLGRTANALPHAFTQKEPYSEWIVELPFLKPHTANIPKATLLNYTVRKDNTISYKSNLYSLPLGTYKGRGSMVALCTEQDELILSSQENEELCRHKINNGRGLKIINTDHKRDKTSVIHEMIEQLCALLENPQVGRDWLDGIRTAKPRYIRDQLMIIRQTIDATSPLLVNKALDYCMLNKITSAIDFKTIVAKYRQELPEQDHETKIIPINPLNGTISAGALIQPEISSIEDYQTILKNKNQL